MAEYKFLMRRDSAENWENINPVLENGEPGFDVTNRQIRVGNGLSAWTSLPVSVDKAFTAQEKAKLSTTVSIMDFGAVGDGTADDGPAFRAAIVAASPGSIILVPAPTVSYRIASSIVVDKTVLFMGGGKTAPVLSVAGAVVCFNVTTNGVGASFTGLHITGDRTTGQKGVYSIANYVSVSDCHITLVDIGVHTNGGYGQRFERLTMRNIKDTLVYIQDGAAAVVCDIYYDTDGSWSGGSYPSPSFGIRLSASDAIINNCQFYHAGTGLIIECPSARNLEFISVSNSIFDNGLTVPSIVVRNASASRLIRDVRFSNVVAGRSRYGVRIDGSNSSIYGISFVGCTFHQNTNEGLRIESGTDIVFSNCRICGNSNAGAGLYPDVYSNTTGELSLESCKLGRYLGFTSSPSYGCVFDVSQGNVFLRHNAFSTGYSQRAMLDNSAGVVTFENNTGLVTENSGIVTLGAAVTTATVTHGLFMAPALNEINFHANSSWGSSTKAWVDTATVDSFVIHVDQAPGGSGVSFSWSVSIKGR